ncbi:MAG: hypothetical protein EAX91_05700 [Candidatus Lokiarchaeota archaeon]|nr:hypothetical protein [Candidatus Lokiarchaeota archaeon]
MIRTKSPGRFCIFREYQDYLNYPVILMKIFSIIYLQTERILEPKFLIHQKDIRVPLEIPMDGKKLVHNSSRDNVIIGYNQFMRKNCTFEKGCEIQITGNLPITAGVEEI